MRVSALACRCTLMYVHAHTHTPEGIGTRCLHLVRGSRMLQYFGPELSAQGLAVFPLAFVIQLREDWYLWLLRTDLTLCL